MKNNTFLIESTVLKVSQGMAEFEILFSFPIYCFRVHSSAQYYNPRLISQASVSFILILVEV